MVATSLGSYTQPETPEEEWFIEDKEGRKYINLLQVPTAPAVIVAQTDGALPDPPPPHPKKSTQMTPSSVEDKAIQTSPPYGTTEY
jgi:hypothetical protein